MMESSTMQEYIYDWSDYYWASNALLATITNLDGFHGRMQLMLRQWICGYGEVGPLSGRQRAWSSVSQCTETHTGWSSATARGVGASTGQLQLGPAACTQAQGALACSCWSADLCSLWLRALVGTAALQQDAPRN